jgi:hypothetical protein
LTAASASASGDKVTASADAPAAVAALPDHGEADAVLGLHDRKLQVLALLQRNFRGHVDREAGDRDPHQIGGQHFQDLGVDHAPRCSTSSGATPPASWAASTGRTGLIDIAMV